MSKEIKYGLLGYDPWPELVVYNVGDYTQSLAARRFLPKVDFIIDRERLNQNYLQLEESHINKLIMNGWFMHRAKNWPPHKVLSPLIISFHITQKRAKEILSPEGIKYLKKHAPIGCRDTYTLELLNAHGVDAYFSGCLTLTLPPKDREQLGDYILSIDLDNEINDFYRKHSHYPILTLNQSILKKSNDEDIRFIMAEKYLELYSKARCVITSRLHAALPCLAMQVPVLLINTQSDQYRFSGLNALVRNGSKEDCLSGKIEFDINNPSPNSSEYLKYRKELIKTVNNYINCKVL